MYFADITIVQKIFNYFLSNKLEEKSDVRTHPCLKSIVFVQKYGQILCERSYLQSLSSCLGLFSPKIFLSMFLVFVFPFIWVLYLKAFAPILFILDKQSDAARPISGDFFSLFKALLNWFMRFISKCVALIRFEWLKMKWL